MTLLHTCARATSYPALTEVLRARAAQVTDWTTLVAEAESQGIAPLVYHHLKAFGDLCPAEARRSLRLLYLRHRHKNTILGQTLAEALGSLHGAGINVLILKGASLCQTIYGDHGLRPMRDIDLLVSKEQGERAQEVLIGLGFTESSAPRPHDHFHLPSLHKSVECIAVCIELHTDLFPRCPPYYRHADFDELAGRSLQLQINGQSAACLGHTDMLWHLFEHGLHMPLTYEPFKLIAVADIITLVESKHAEIDWQRLDKENPHIRKALPNLHFISPWQEHAHGLVGHGRYTPPKAVGQPFSGWPHLRLSEQRQRGLAAILKETFLPPEWWARTYYGCSSRWTYLCCIVSEHPRHIWWWAKLYASFLLPESPPSPQKGGLPCRSRLTALSTIAMALLNKLKNI
jgi:Uncharacterised nucleotidyltransferase